MDSAIIGGVSVAEIVHGKVAESQIPSDVVEAFRTQYPHHGSSFVEAVNNLSSDPTRLMGLINGVKGKLLEMDYVEWLNNGHLPAGHTAQLAQHANNPAWDIAIKDSQGHLNQVLQVKATASLDYVRQAVEAHPDIDVVVPHELYERMSVHPELMGHVLDSHERIAGMNEHLAQASSHADAAGIHFHLPIMAVAFAVGQNFVSYRQDRISLQQAVEQAAERSSLAVFATAAGWAVSLLAHEPVVGAPVSFAARLVGGQALHNWRRREMLNLTLKRITDSVRRLTEQLKRPGS